MRSQWTNLIRLQLLLLFPLFSNATSITVSGEVSGLWNADTVFVTGHLLVPKDAILTIEPGTRVEFQSYFRMDVQGGVIAMGSLNDSILFTIHDTSNFYSQTSGRGGWSGIRFIDTPVSSDSSIFSYCRFEFSKAAEDSSNCYGGAILATNHHKIRVNHCLFYHNYSHYSGGAVYLWNSNAVIEHCCFRNNYAGNTGTIYGYGGGVCSLHSSPAVNYNEFYSNSSTGVGGAASFDDSDPTFNNNVMEYNYSALGGALGVLRSSPLAAMVNNLVTQNSALFFGGGVCCIRSFPVFSNMTIADNMSAYGGGYYCNDSAAPRMYNSIIWGNQGFGTSVYIWDIFSAPSFYYCNIEGDTSGFEGSGGNEGYHGEYFDNINLPPHFTYSSYFPYRLSSYSPCVDTGTPDPGFLQLPEVDLSGSPRIWNNRIDMGAYEYSVNAGTNISCSRREPISVFPNPFWDKITVKTSLPLSHPVQCHLINSQGQRIRTLTLPPGDISTLVLEDASQNPLPKGIYYLCTENESLTFPPLIRK